MTHDLHFPGMCGYKTRLLVNLPPLRRPTLVCVHLNFSDKNRCLAHRRIGVIWRVSVRPGQFGRPSHAANREPLLLDRGPVEYQPVIRSRGCVEHPQVHPPDRSPPLSIGATVLVYASSPAGCVRLQPRSSVSS